MKFYKSKIDLWFPVLMTGIPLVTFYRSYEAYLSGREYMSDLGAGILTLVLFAFLMGTTKYVLSEHDLIVSMFGIKKKIRLQDISQIHRVKSYWSSMALSSDRLRLMGEFGVIVEISPMDKEDFLLTIQKISPEIKIF